MQVKTERGLIFVEKYVRTEDEAKQLGYTYAFNSHEAKAKCYSRVTGQWSRVFCLVPYEWKEEWNEIADKYYKDIKPAEILVGVETS